MRGDLLLAKLRRGEHPPAADTAAVTESLVNGLTALRQEVKISGLTGVPYRDTPERKAFEDGHDRIVKMTVRIATEALGNAGFP